MGRLSHWRDFGPIDHFLTLYAYFIGVFDFNKDFCPLKKQHRSLPRVGPSTLFRLLQEY
jgi:hypothetical protein